MKFPLKDVAAALGSALDHTEMVTGWSVDTRTLERGDVFFALRGPNHDGHDHIAEAFSKGAIAAVVESDRTHTGPLIRVTDTLTSLQDLARWARLQWRGKMIAITGSAGKTTTKDAVALMLATRFTVGKTAGNFNNHVGVPLSLLRMPADAEFGVIEIGMNHAGEIRELAALARPRVAVVTNVGSAHIENFESVDGVAAAKRELVEALPDDGIAVLNADDERVVRFASAHAGRTITFGILSAADVRATNIDYTGEGASFDAGGAHFQTRVFGRHGILNLLAAIAVASIFGIEPAELVEAASGFEPAKMRGSRFHRNGILIFDDCYNSNPDAARAMLDVLRDTPALRRIAVLGEMLELGRWAGPLHREVGSYVASAGINLLVGIRGVARQMVDAAVEGGLETDAAFFFEQPEDAGLHLRNLARPGDAILFKGSRGTHVERALERFLG